MTNEQHRRNLFLTAKIGHKNETIDFSTWFGFGELWEWSKEQDWCKEFRQIYLNKAASEGVIVAFLINPDRFANAVYEFLKEAK